MLALACCRLLALPLDRVHRQPVGEASRAHRQILISVQHHALRVVNKMTMRLGIPGLLDAFIYLRLMNVMTVRLGIPGLLDAVIHRMVSLGGLDREGHANG